MKQDVDIVIYGAGIAGLWLFHHLRRAGYDVLLLEKNQIGGGQSIASQGIIHSGLKYTLAGKVNDLAKSISAMPQRWIDATQGRGPIDLSDHGLNLRKQHLLIPGGFMGGITKVITEKTFGDQVQNIAHNEWPPALRDSGFQGSLVAMNEPVLDIPQIIKALALPFIGNIRKGDETTGIRAKLAIHTAAEGNHLSAIQSKHDQGLETQKRPLLMGMLKGAPFDLCGHLVGKSDKPLATITTHYTHANERIWYIGGQAAERPKDANPQEVFDFTRETLVKFLPNLDLSGSQWATLPIDRVEGKSGSKGWMPDTPTIHKAEDHLYCWPTKLTFAPMLTDMVITHIEAAGIMPGDPAQDWRHLPEAEFATPPWETDKWGTK